MRERLTTLALALAALLVFVTIFVHAGGPPGDTASAPTSVDRGDNGLLGALSWLGEEGVRTRALHERFTTLAGMHDLPARGNLLLVTLPATLPFRNDEARVLDDWVQQGNTLLVLAALSDRPAWARDRGVLASDLRLISGLDVELSPLARRAARGAPATPLAQATGVLLKPQRDTLVPSRPDRYLTDVHAVAGFSDYAPRRWKLELPHAGFPLCLARLEATGGCALWLLCDGAGSMLLSGFGSLLSNRALGEADNAQLLANLVRASVGADGVVLFDDEHQGLTDAYDPDKFFRDRRLYLTFGILAAVWLVWVTGGTRLAPPPAPAAPQGEADLVRATGSFLARVLRPSAAARRMFEHFFRRLQPILREPTLDPSPYWDWLESNPRLARAEVAQLRTWYTDAWSGTKVPIARLHNLIVRTEMQIAA